MNIFLIQGEHFSKNAHAFFIVHVTKKCSYFYLKYGEPKEKREQIKRKNSQKLKYLSSLTRRNNLTPELGHRPVLHACRPSPAFPIWRPQRRLKANSPTSAHPLRAGGPFTYFFSLFCQISQKKVGAVSRTRDRFHQFESQ